MKRWIACKKILVNEGGSESYAPAVSVHTDNFRCWSKDGINWMICQIGIQDLTPVQADTDCHIIPDVSFDLVLSNIPSATRTAMKNKLEALGVTNYAEVKLTWTIRQFLTWLGQKLQPTMNPERGDVADF